MNRNASRTPAEFARVTGLKARLKSELEEAEREPRSRRPTLGELTGLVAERKKQRAALGLRDDEAPRRPRKPTLSELRAKFRQLQDGNGGAKGATGGSNHGVEGEAAEVPLLASGGRPDRHALMARLRRDKPTAIERGVAPKSYKRTRLQEAIAEWLGDVEWNLMVTFTFEGEDGVSLPLATKLFGKFIPRLREIVLRKGSTRRIPMAAVVENSREQLQQVGLQVDGREGTHIHVLLRVRGDDPYKYKDAIEKAWKLTNRRCGGSV